MKNISKKILYSLLAFANTLFVFGQPLQLNLNMNPRPSPYLSDWQERTETIMLNILNPGQNPAQVRLGVQILRDGQLKASSDYTKMPVLTVPRGTMMVNAEQVVVLQAMSFFGDDKNVAVRTGKLPSSQYQLCVQLLQAETGQPISQPVCRNFEIISYQLPYLLQPVQNFTTTCQQVPTLIFRWSSLTPTYTFGTMYHFVLCEVLPGQTPMNAFRANHPIIEQDVYNTTQLVFPPDFDVTVFQPQNSTTSTKTQTRTYVWSVRTTGIGGQLITDNDGWSEPNTFTVTCSPTGTRTRDTTTSCFCKGELVGIGYEADNDVSKEYIGGPFFLPEGNTGTTVTYSSSVSFWIRFRMNCIMPCMPSVKGKWTITFTDEKGNTSTLPSGSGIGATVSPPSSGTITATYTGEMFCGTASCGSVTTTKTVKVNKSAGTTTTTDGGTTTTGGGTTTTTERPPTTTTREECKCSCWVKSDIETGKSARGNTTYKAKVEGGCKNTPCKGSVPHCTHTIKYLWSFGSGDGAAEMIGDPKGEMVEVRCIKPGWYSITLSGNVICSDGTKCPFGGNFEVYCPGDSLPDKCPPPELQSEKATPVSLGSKIDAPAEFPYPRALPIRASAIDMDYGILQCTPCKEGAISQKKIPVQDGITYSWVLEGKGTLNTMPSIKLANDIEKEIEKLLQQIAEVQSKIDSLETIKKEIPKKLEQQKNVAERQLEVIKAQLDSVGKKLKEYTTSVENEKKQIGKNETLFGDVQTTITDKKKESSAVKKEIDSIDVILQGKQSPEELAKLKEIATQQKTMESAQKARDADVKKLTDKTAELAATIKTLLAEYKAAQVAYESLRSASSGDAKSVGAFQTSLYPAGAPREFFKSQRDFTDKATIWIATQAAGNATLSAEVKAVNDIADSALATPVGATRTGLGTLFTTRLTALGLAMAAECTGKSDADKRAACSAALDIVSSAQSVFMSNHVSLLATPFTLDKLLKSKIASARAKIGARESALASAESELKKKALAYSSAVEANKTELALYVSKADASAKLFEKESDKLSALQAELKVLETKRIEALDKIRVSLLRERGTVADKKRGIDSTVRLLQDSLVVLSDSIATEKARVLIANKEITRLTDEKNKLIAQKTSLEDILKIDANKIIDALQKQIDDANKELDELKKKLADKKRDKDVALTGNKIADGELVYYVPPPIEVLMDDAQKKRFDELKDSVAKTEASVVIALAKKQAVQKKLTLLLERTLRETMRYHDASGAVASGTEEIDSLKRELSHVKNDGKKQQADEQLKAQQAVKDAEEEVKKQEEKVKMYQDKVDKLKTDIEAQEKNVETAKEEATAAGKKVLELKAGIDKEKDLEAKAKQTLAERTADLEKARAELKEKHGATGQAQSELNHAIAANNQTAAATARSKVQVADAEEKLAKTKVASLESDVASVAASVKAATDRVTAATKEYEDARKEFSAKSQARIAAIDELNELNKRLEKDVAPRLDAAKDRLQEAKETVDDKQTERAELNEKINEGLDSLDDAKEIAKTIEEAEKAKKTGEAIMKECEANVTSALAERDSSIKAAQDSLKQSRDNLAKAKKELHDFLFDIFSNPNLKDKLTITATDTVTDGWRAKDGPQVEVKEISYSGRIPVFTNTEPAGGLGTDVHQGECPIENTFLPQPPLVGTDPSVLRKEPRTIALMYKNGEPLWKEWAVIPEDEPILARDYTFLTSSASDADISRRVCGPAKAKNCAEAANGSSIIDLITYSWALDGGLVLGMNNQQVAWKAGEVPKPKCKKTVIHTVTYKDTPIATDVPVDKKMLPEVKAGVMIEVTKKLVGAPNTTDTVVARVVCGDHKGLAGEDVEVIVTIKPEYAKLTKDYGLEKPNQHKVVKQTDGDGYIHIPFLFGSGFAEFDMTVEWKRERCYKDTLLATMPLYLQFLKFADSPPNAAVEAGKKVWEGALSLEAASKSMPEKNEDADKDENYAKRTHAIVGVTDNEREPANDIMIEYLKNPKNKKPVTYTPPKVATELFGIARTLVSSLPKDPKEEVWIKAQCAESALQKLSVPKDVEGKKSGKDKRFKIGSASMPFIVELDEPASSGETVYGNGKLIVENLHEFLQSFIDIPLAVNGVYLEGEGDAMIAKQGFVSWKPGEGKKVEYKGFTFRVDSLSITSSAGAMIGGGITHQKYLPDGAGFHAELETSGNFFGSVSDLPEVKFAKCTLKKGSSFTLDMHETRDEDEIADELKPFVGIVINKAELILPKTFSTTDGKDTTNSELSVESFAIGRKYKAGEVAIGGTVKVSGKFFKMGFGGWKCDFSSLEFSFANSELKEGKLSGAIHMPIPFEGDIDFELSGSKEEWSGTISTAHPVSVPKIKTVFSLLDGTSISYKPETSLATLSINATATCEYFKRLDIKNLTLDNTGKIVGEVSITEPNIKFGRGFDLAISKLTIKKEEDKDLSITVKGTFSIPNIIALKGGVELTTGPSVKVSLDETSIKFDYGPCSFSGGFAFSETEFRGDFDIGLKNLCTGGITGKLIAGVQKVDETKSFTYWYGELTAKVAIPLGQTTLFITELGGGIGYNYEPPVGTQSGNPKELPNSLAFKAIVGIGTPSTGSLMNSRVEMVLIPWTEFTIYGKIWLLNKKDALFGEGKLTLSTEPASLSGFVRLFIGVPDAKGKILSFDGNMEFKYSESEKYIRSKTLSGSALQVIKAEGKVSVTQDSLYVDGTLRYDFDKKIPLGVVDFYVSLHAYAGGTIAYYTSTSKLKTKVEFKGSVDVKGDFPIYGMSTLLTGSAKVAADLEATPYSVKITAGVHVSYSVFGYSDALDIDVGYSS